MNYLLIGRANAGKSSIFNKLTSTHLNIIHSEEGTTRDWHKQIVSGTDSYIYDTPGVLINKNNKNFYLDIYFNNILKTNINIFLYVIDYKNGFNEIDNFNINQLRKYNRKIILIINKCDQIKNNSNNEFYKFGIDTCYFISCAHNLGFNELSLIFKSSKNKLTELNQIDLSIAFFGKPNVGKSTLLNSILGYKRSETSPIAGTTSDYVTDFFYYKKKYIKIIDTAGIGKKSHIKNKSITQLSIQKTFQNFYIVDYAIVLIDSCEGIDKQDKRIIKLVSESSKGLILLFNKYDLIKNKVQFKSDTIYDIEKTLSEVKNIKIFFTSALKKKNIFKILDYLYKQYFFNESKITTSNLNKWLKNVAKEYQHPLVENKRINFKYAVIINERPITIKIFCNYSNKIKNNYKKYLFNNFNYHFKILNQKTKFIFSSSKNPYI